MLCICTQKSGFLYEEDHYHVVWEFVRTFTVVFNGSKKVLRQRNGFAEKGMRFANEEEGV
jgi:hypothetical protein